MRIKVVLLLKLLREGGSVVSDAASCRLAEAWAVAGSINAQCVAYWAPRARAAAVMSSLDEGGDSIHGAAAYVEWHGLGAC